MIDYWFDAIFKTHGALAELIIYTCMHKGEGDNMASDDGQTVINLGSEKNPNNELNQF